jgi:hypothetical protein
MALSFYSPGSYCLSHPFRIMEKEAMLLSQIQVNYKSIFQAAGFVPGKMRQMSYEK